ncbi:MAG: coproporphyrinogen dehydrogenase HemZ [Oscillospiraceae bacterium]|jgi:oxygen-independent coproporphyrinogen-3 oxidase|nr:coproporphyrinogen dehydrogenase HemZ [Oscillospiraceae bacterium]
MKLTLLGHNYRYAAEQILLMMFPGELPEYGESASGYAATVKLTRAARFVTARTVIRGGEGSASGVSRAAASSLTGELERDRVLQRIIKLSFYRAAARLTGYAPAWGALTGVRPSTIVSKLLRRGVSEESAVKTLTRDYFVSPPRAALCLDAARAELAAAKTLKARDVALYIGIPFFPTRCAYCSFVSHSVEKSMKLIEPFLAALSVETDALAAAVRSSGRRIVSVYIGGGTPTTLTATQMDALLKKLAEAFDLSCVREYTVEAGRPDTITREKLRVMKARGVTRVSVNPQTMSDRVLRAIGRRHTAQEARDAVALVREVGIAALNMDLIAGLPGDTESGFSASLEEALSLAPENITVHTLSLKKGARIKLEAVPVPLGDAVAAMLGRAQTLLRGADYAPYYLYRQKFASGGFENTGWSRAGHNGLYNICMMDELTSVLSLGGGGVTKLVSRAGGKIERIFNPKYPYEYIERMERIAAGKKRIQEFFMTEERRDAISSITDQ